MDINGNSRIREILQHCPHADAIFDSSGVAYFGHDQSLDEACAEGESYSIVLGRAESLRA